MNDPTRFARRRSLVTWCIGALLIAPAAAWSLLPPPINPAPALQVAAALPSADAQGTGSLDLSAFRARIWVPTARAAAPKAEPTPPPAPAPLRLQLIGILRETATESDTTTLRAALYDPDSDKLFIVGAGDTLGSHRVAQITPTGVVLAQGAPGGRTSTLLVHAPERAGAHP
jgi:hypothetical protein